MTTANASVTELLSVRFPGTATDVRAQLVRIDAAAAAGDITQELRAEMQLALGEVLNNIVEHALAARKDGWVACDMVWDRSVGRVSFDISDNGTPLPPVLLIEAGAAPDVSGPIDELPEDGFGWFIVHSLADDLVYERIDGTNRLTFSLGAAA